MIVVTGASGFIGSHVVDALLARGERVRACIRNDGDDQWLRGKPVELAVIDVVTGAGLERAMVDASVVYHLAGQTGNATESRFQEVNHHGAVRTAEVARRVASGLKRFVLVSSTMALGPSEPARPRLEGDRAAPVGPYGRSKRDAEVALRSLSDLPLVILRPPATIGPRDPMGLQLFRLARHGVLPVLGPRTQRVTIAYVEDVARATAALGLAELGGANEFHLPAEDLDWPEMAGFLTEALGRRTHAVRIPTGLSRVAARVTEWWFEGTGCPIPLHTRKLEELQYPSWTSATARDWTTIDAGPRIGLHEGLVRSVRWYRDQGWL